MTVWYKQGVYGDLKTPAQKALGRVGSLAFAAGEDIFVTSIRDGNHWFGSLHYIGQAFDVRPLYNVTLQQIKEKLGTDFDVVNEGNHWHIEYDPKG